MSAPQLPPALQQGVPGRVVYRHKPTLDELMTPRRRHIPTFYQGHADENAIVLDQSGKPLLAETDGEPVRIGEITLERRWAVGSLDRNTGILTPGSVLLSKEDFRFLYARWYEEFYRLVAEQRNIGSISHPGNVMNDAFPAVKDFVLWSEDPMDNTKEIPMHYRNATAGARPEVMVDAKGENPRSRDDVLLETYRVQPDKLTTSEREYVESQLLSGDDPMKRLAKLNAQLVNREIDLAEFNRLVAEVTGSADVPIVGQVPTGRVEMTCGAKVWKSKADEHRERCEVCGGPEAA